MKRCDIDIELDEEQIMGSGLSKEFAHRCKVKLW